MKKMFGIVKKITDILCWVIIILLVVAIALSLIARINGSTPSLFGYSIFRVATGSMKPELEVGDVILDKKYDENTELKVGDIVTYHGSEELSGILITHKVIKEPYTENGVTYVQTQGIANEIPDEPITLDRIEAVMVCELDFFDDFYNIFFSPWGFLIILGLLIFIFVDEIIVLVKVITGNEKSAKDGENINDIIGRLQAENNEESDVESTDSNES